MTARAASIYLLIVLAVGVAPAAAQVRGISYTLSPEAGRFYFDRNAALADDYVYGGAVGFGIGQLVELSALYRMSPSIRRDLSEITGIDERMRATLQALPVREIRLSQYGGRLRLNLASGGIVPFVTIGTGVLDFAADDLNSSRHVYGSAGGGIQLTAGDRYALWLAAENLAYRYSLGSTLFTPDDLDAAGLTPQNFGQTLVYNWALQAALKVYLGGVSPGTRTDVDRALQHQLGGGLAGLQLVVEPFYGSVAFSSELNFAPNQRFGGVFSGLDLGPHVGIRGFYWRGMNDGELTFDDLQAFGGELRLALASGRHLTPFVSIGGGYLDVLDGYEGREGARPSGEAFLMGGLGIRLPITPRVQASAGLRTLLISSEGVDNVSQPSDIYLSTMLNGGIRFSIGRGAPEPVIAEAIEEEVLDPRQAELRRLRQRIDELERGVVTVDTVQTAASPGVRSYRSDQIVSIPVPEEGEIYIRYGPPAGTMAEPLPGGGVAIVDTSRTAGVAGGLTAAEIQRIVRETVRQELAGLEPGAPSEAALRRFEQRINDQLDAVARRVDRLALRDPAAPPVIIERDVRPGQDRITQIETIAPADGLVAATAFVGMTAGDATNLTLGVRGDYRADFLRFLDWHPEFTIGFGTGGYAYNLNLHAVYSLDFLRSFVPYAGLGFGLLGFNDPPEDVSGIQIVFNTVVGAEFTLRDRRLFAEYAAMDLGDYHRLIVGFRVAF